VGGAVTGSAVAYFLAAQSEGRCRSLVVERDPTYADCATSRSVGGVRQQFSTPENILMSKFGAEFIRDAAARLAVDGEAAAVPFVAGGYLFLATEAGLPVLRRNHAVQREHGAATILLDRDGLARRFPWLNLDGLAAGGFGAASEGWTDPYALMQAFRRKARSLGAAYVADEVAAMELGLSRVEAVRLKSGDRVACGAVVNAAGIRAAEVAAMAGLALPVRPRKRFVYVFNCREEVADLPLTIDPSGVYVRPEGTSFLCGVSPPEDRDPDCTDFELDYAPFEDVVWPALAHRIPAFEAIKLARAWVGHYDYNALDQNAILGPHPEIGNFHFANGFSGHGLQQSPAVGRAVAELILFGAYRTIDLGRFSYERVRRNEPLVELNVV
jgi:sarcosine oxidase